jgi:hypothetical protein
MVDIIKKSSWEQPESQPGPRGEGERAREGGKDDGD